MLAVKVPDNLNRSKPYKYGIDSFKQWCNKNDCDFVVMDEVICPIDELNLIFQRYYAFDILDNSGIDYDQILITDADAIIHPDCPNFFKLTDRKYTVVHADGSYDWVCRSLENYSKHLFEKKTFLLWKYFNGGFQIVNKKHRYLWKEIIDFYWANKDLILQMHETFHVGMDQPIINFIVNLSGVDMKFLPYSYCMVDLPRKELLDEELTFTKIYKGIYQFNAIPQNSDASQTYFWMKKTYNKLYGELNE